jgi:hypothetical protein
MVQNITQEDHVPRLIGKRKPAAIECDDRDKRIRADEHIHAGETKVWAPLQKQRVDKRVATTHVKHRAIGRDELRQMRREHSSASRMDGFPMDNPDRVKALHGDSNSTQSAIHQDDVQSRSMPNMLQKKLFRIVLAPSVTRVAPGTTYRIVAA